MATELYRDTIAWADRNLDEGGVALQHTVWDGTPWMVDAFTGSIESDRDYEIRKWCNEEFGPEARPIHGIPGAWHRGVATVNGWTWIGFAEREMMERFVAAWPKPE